MARRTYPDVALTPSVPRDGAYAAAPRRGALVAFKTLEVSATHQPAASWPAEPSPAQPASPYMTREEAAVYLRKLHPDGTPNVQAVWWWCRRRGIHPNAARLYDRRELDMALARRRWPGEQDQHAQTVATRMRGIYGSLQAKRPAKGLPPVAAQLRSTLQRGGHTDTCIDALTLEEITAQGGDPERANRWCADHACRARRAVVPPTCPPVVHPMAPSEECAQ